MVLLTEIGRSKRETGECCAAGRPCQLGLRARIAVAEVGSGGRRRKVIAGALHSVQHFAWLEGWTNLLSTPTPRAAWACESYPGLRITAIGTSRLKFLQSRHL